MSRTKKQCIGCGNVRVCPHRHGVHVLCATCRRRLRRLPVPCALGTCATCRHPRLIVPTFLGGTCLQCYAEGVRKNRHRKRRCGECGEMKTLILRRGRTGICPECIHRVRWRDPRTKEPCDDCGFLRHVSYRKENGLPQCLRCARQDPKRFVPCGDCGEIRFPQYTGNNGKPQCQQCYSKVRPLERCIGCERQRKVHKRLPQGPACNVCCNRLRQGKLVLVDIR